MATHRDSGLGADDLACIGQALQGRTTLTSLNGVSWSIAGGGAHIDARCRSMDTDGAVVFAGQLVGLSAVLETLDLRYLLRAKSNIGLRWEGLDMK